MANNEFDTPLPQARGAGIVASNVQGDTSLGDSLSGIADFAGKAIEAKQNIDEKTFVEDSVDNAAAIFNADPATDPITEGLSESDKKEVNAISNKVSRIQEGGRQGKFNNVIRTESFIKQQIARRPDLENQIRSSAKRRLGLDIESEASRINKLGNKVAEKEISAAADEGAAIFNDSGEVDINATREAGREILQAKAEIENAEANRGLKVNESTDKLTQSTFKQLKPTLESFTQQASLLVENGVAGSSEKEKLQTIEDLAVQVERRKSLAISNLRRSAAVGGHPPEAIDTAVEQVSSAFDDISQFFKADTEALKSRLDRVKNQNDLSVEEAIGQEVALIRAGGDSLSNAVSQALVVRQGEAKAANQIASGLERGIGSILNQDNGQLRKEQALGVADVMSGRGELSDLSKKNRSGAIKGLSEAVRTGSRIDLTEQVGVEAFNNSSSEVLEEVSNNGNLQDITSTANMYNNAWRSKMKGDVQTKPDVDSDKTMRSLLRFSQNAAPRIGRNLDNQVNSTEFHKLNFNPQKGIEIVEDKEAISRANPINNINANPRTPTFRVPKVPEGVKDSLKAFNNTIENVLMAQGFDGSLEGMSEEEVRELVSRFVPSVNQKLGARPEQQPDENGILRSQEFKPGTGRR